MNRDRERSKRQEAGSGIFLLRLPFPIAQGHKEFRRVVF